MEILFIVLVINILVWLLVFKKRSKKREIKKEKPPQPKDFDNYYVYKSKLAEYNESQYDEFLEKCKKGECNYIEKEIISPELEKGNKNIDELKQKL